VQQFVMKIRQFRSDAWQIVRKALQPMFKNKQIGCFPVEFLLRLRMAEEVSVLGTKETDFRVRTQPE